MNVTSGFSNCGLDTLGEVCFLGEGFFIASSLFGFFLFVVLIAFIIYFTIKFIIDTIDANQEVERINSRVGSLCGDVRSLRYEVSDLSSDLIDVAKKVKGRKRSDKK
jgi:cell division protein FtsL